jgi:hypothetical protein
MSNSEIGIPIRMGKEFKIGYMGGHKAFLRKTHTKFRLYEDGVELMEPNLRIPYSSMSRIENMEEKISVTCSSIRYSGSVMEEEMLVYNNLCGMLKISHLQRCF